MKFINYNMNQSINKIIKEFRKQFINQGLTEKNGYPTVRRAEIKEFESFLRSSLEAVEKENRTALEWALSDDTGMSSEALARHMLGFNHYGHYPAPSDKDDRGRCIRLLNLIPEWWDRLDEMAQYPSGNLTYFKNGKVLTRKEGWTEQIPLIRKESLSNKTETEKENL